MGILISLAFSLVLSMAGDPFRVLTPGDPVGAGEGPFNAQWHNMATESIRVSQRATPPGMTPREVVKDRDTEIWVANITEEDIDEYRPVGLGDLAIYPSDNGDFRERLCFLSDKLESGRPFGIAQGPIGTGKLYVCKVAAGPGGQPPTKKWLRLLEEAEPWDPLETYAPGEPVVYIGPADPWTVGQAYVTGDLVESDDVVYACVAEHTADTGNAPPNDDFWEIYEGEEYAALVKHSGHEPPSNPTYWLLIGPHRGVWNRGDTYAPGEVVIEPNLGRVIADGISRAWINVIHAADQYATVANDELQSTASGPIEILWRQGGLGEQWSVVRLCCGAVLTPLLRTSDGEVVLAPMSCDGAGSYIYRPGGALKMGAMTCAGSGENTWPAPSGTGTLALGPMQSSGSGNSYMPTPSGSLYAAPMTLTCTGTRTLPPTGSGLLKSGAMKCLGLGTRSAPTRSGSGAWSLGPLACSAGRGSYGNAAMFVAKMTNPLFHAPTGRWVYDWIEQTINPSNGDYQDLAGGKSGNTSAGPFMRERNNTLVGVPVFSLARLRGAWSGQPLYDFEHCCSKGTGSASGSLVGGAMTCAGSGLAGVPTTHVGGGNLQLGVMHCAGNGLSNAYSVNVGVGDPQSGAMMCAGTGLSSALSVHVGVGKPQLGAVISAGTGVSIAPVYVGGGNLQFGSMICLGSGLSSAISVNVGVGKPQLGAMTCAGSGVSIAPVYVGSGNLQFGTMICAGSGVSANSINIGSANLLLGAMTCVGSGEAWIDTQESSEGGVAAGGSHQNLSDLGTQGGVAAGGSHQALSDLGTQGGVSAGGSHQTLSDLGTQGGIAAGGSHQTLSDLGTQGGVAAGGSHQTLSDLGTQGGVAAGGSHQSLSDLGTQGGVAAGGSHQTLSNLGIEGGVAAGGSHRALSDLTTQGGIAAGGSHQVVSDLGTQGGVAAGGDHQTLSNLGTQGGVAPGGEQGA